MSTSPIQLIGITAYGAIAATAMSFAAFSVIEKRRNMRELQEDILKKLSEDYQITAKDIFHFGRSFNLSTKQTITSIYSIYRKIDNKEAFGKLKLIVSEIEREEPFDDLPDEVKPSLVRLSHLTESSPEASDRHILQPITSTLNKYVELQSNYEKVKRRNNLAILMTVVSFVITLISFYYTAKTPTTNEIKKAIEPLLQEKKQDNPIKQ
jgi:hypothetical protein